MDRLAEIVFRIPDSPSSKQFLGDLKELLADVTYASNGSPDSLTLTPPAPLAARPATTFQLADVPTPEIVFDACGDIRLPGGGGPAPHRDRMKLADLTRRIAGSVTRVDHTGVNLPARSLSTTDWADLVRTLAAAATMYRYPTGEQWPFLLPSTEAELATDIRDFVVGREPRFELVYDPWCPCTTWQFALWTTFTRTELENLFPAPVGIALPGLEEIFRTVYVESPWPDLEIRLDLCFRVDGPSDWETGQWLVTEGGRIR
ncbi:hypothetical protein OHA21_12745 [Actinoplanes sp. NBC_00393]|uniref:hypothetical protein n=1 Tax=Actinoplanes sp. NBC_00393 TaxID=2975953 RepID=UPI002E1FDB83